MSIDDLPGELDVTDAEVGAAWRCQQIDALRWDYRLRDHPEIPWQTLTLRADAQDFTLVEQLRAALLEALRNITGVRP